MGVLGEKFFALLRLCLVFILIFVVSCSASNSLAPVSQRGYAKINTRYYQVKKGDTLYSIAWRSGNDYRTVAKWNHIKPPYTIYVGQTIRLFKPEEKKAGKISNPTPTVAKRTTPPLLKKTLKVFWEWPLKGLIAKNFVQTGKKGIDILGKHGQPVLAAAPGKVVYSGQGLIGYGNLIIVKHNDEYLSAYGHNRRLLVEEGQYVEKGQKIAEVGTAAGKQPSLHFEIRKNGKPVDPLHYLPKR